MIFRKLYLLMSWSFWQSFTKIGSKLWIIYFSIFGSVAFLNQSLNRLKRHILNFIHIHSPCVRSEIHVKSCDMIYCFTHGISVNASLLGNAIVSFCIILLTNQKLGFAHTANQLLFFQSHIKKEIGMRETRPIFL